MQQSVLSLEYVHVPVAAKLSGLPINVSLDVVQMAFPLPDIDPVVGDWKAAIWDTDATTTPTTYEAKCLVGPSGTITLAVAVYDVWVKVIDSIETVARRAGTLEII